MVRDLPNLLLSLIFWTKACATEGGAGFDGTCLVEGLRETERSRFSKVELASPANDRVSQAVGAGIDALANSTTDSAATAEAAFSAVVKDAPSEAKQAFPELFASRILISSARRLEQNCPLSQRSVLSHADLSAEVKAEIDDFFDAAALVNSEEAWQHLRVCRLRSYDPQAEASSATNDLENLLAYEPRSDWSADDEVAAAMFALKARQEGRLPSNTHLEEAKRLLARAFGKWGSSNGMDKAEATFSEALGVCAAARGPRWCWSVLEAGLAAYGKPDVATAINLAGTWLTEETSVTPATASTSLMQPSRI
jgi:hypothetical protein